MSSAPAYTCPHGVTAQDCEVTGCDPCIASLVALARAQAEIDAGRHAALFRAALMKLAPKHARHRRHGPRLAFIRRHIAETEIVCRCGEHIVVSDMALIVLDHQRQARRSAAKREAAARRLRRAQATLERWRRDWADRGWRSP